MQVKKISKILLLILVLCLLLTSCDQGVYKTSSKDEFDGVVYGTIDIDLQDAKIQIIGSDHYGYSILYSAEKDIELSLIDGKFTVKEKTQKKLKNVDPIEITFYIDSTKGLNQLKVDVISGELKIQDSLIRKIDIETVSADVEIDKTSFENSLNIKGVSTSLKVTDSSMLGLDFKCVSGSVDIDGVLLGGATLNTVSGDVNLKLAGNVSDYYLNATGLSSKVTWNGSEYNFGAGQLEIGNKEATNRIKFSTVAGNLNINIQ